MKAGTVLAHYEITDRIGKGGMGEVYRARDTKLGREVAINVLPSEFSRDRERLARLEREARMLAALNHPSIAAIHGLEESDDTRFLVLDLVDGGTLADRLKTGAIPRDRTGTATGPCGSQLAPGARTRARSLMLEVKSLEASMADSEIRRLKKPGPLWILPLCSMVR